MNAAHVATHVTRCLCGTRHRAGTHCATAARIRARHAPAARALEQLRHLPAGTLSVLDERPDDGRRRARTLADADSYLRRYSDAAATTTWGTTWTTAQGEEVRFLTDHGGFVANSYGYPATADWLSVVAAEGRVVVLLTRSATASRPHGQGTVTDRLLPPDTIARVVQQGRRYNAAWVTALRAALRLHRLHEHRLARHTLDATEDVDLDRALELGWIDSECLQGAL